MQNVSRSPAPEGWEVLALPTPTLPPATSTNTAIFGAGAFVVIDPGTPHGEHIDTLLGAVQARLVGGARFRGVCLTHHHPDHWGALSALCERFTRVRTWAHPRTHRELPRLDGVVARELRDGERVELDGAELTALHTPGHTRGHMSFWDRSQGAVYGGDVVATEGTIVVDPPDGDMAAYLDSLARLRRLNLSTLIPSHGDIVEDPEALLGWYIQHRLRREEKVMAALSDTTLEGAEVLLPRAYPEVPPTIYPLAARSLLAHLIKLGDEGRAERVGERWRRVDALGGGPVHNP